jgi:hypothetical protein
MIQGVDNLSDGQFSGNRNKVFFYRTKHENDTYGITITPRELTNLSKNEELTHFKQTPSERNRLLTILNK